MINSGIYLIRNCITDKYYIGSAIDFTRRFRKHLRALNRNEHFNAHLQNAWNKYGSDNFTFSVLEYVEDKFKLLEREQYWFDETKISNRYNLYPIAGSPLGVKKSESTKLKISAASSKSQLGRKLTDAHKLNIKLALQKVEISPERRAKMIAGLRAKCKISV